MFRKLLGSFMKTLSGDLGFQYSAGTDFLCENRNQSLFFRFLKAYTILFYETLAVQSWNPLCPA